MDKRRVDIYGPSTPSLSAPGTPTVAAAAARLTSMPSTPLQQTQLQHSVSTLPSPEVFDIIPPLHELLSRLLSTATTSNGSTTAIAYKSAEPLGFQQLVAEASAVRNRIRRARRAVEVLPDVEREVVEQEREIVELRARIEKQRKVLSEIGA